MRKSTALITVLVTTGLGLTACAIPSQRPPSEHLPCTTRYEPEPLQPIPTAVDGHYVPTHAVRAQAYTCVDGFWVPIGGVTSVTINAEVATGIATGTVKTGVATVWPYHREVARLGFELPLIIAEPGIEAGISGHFTSLLDPDEMLACWVVDVAGREVPGSRGTAVNTGKNPTVVDAYCTGIIST